MGIIKDLINKNSIIDKLIRHNLDINKHTEFVMKSKVVDNDNLVEIIINYSTMKTDHIVEEKIKSWAYDMIERIVENPQITVAELCENLGHMLERNLDVTTEVLKKAQGDRSNEDNLSLLQDAMINK
jgi:hypothetical protein